MFEKKNAYSSVKNNFMLNETLMQAQNPHNTG